MAFTINITNDQVSALLVNAFEGGSTYWMNSYDYDRLGDREAEELHTPLGLRLEAKFQHGWLPLADCPITVFWDEDENDSSSQTHGTLDRAALQRGLDVMSTRYPRHMADAVQGNDDADTADVFLQCCLFGELVYG